MRKRVFGRQLKRTTKQRRALFRSLIRSLILYGRIKTTEAKAKAVRGTAEKVVTLAKKKGELVRVKLGKDYDSSIVNKVIDEIAPKFKDRPGGYTRIVKLGLRYKDSAPMVFLEWTEPIEVQSSKFKVQSKKNMRSEKKSKSEEKKIDKTEKKERKNEKSNKINKRK